MSVQAPSLIVPIGEHFFSASELDAALQRTLPQLPPGRSIALGAAVDASGVGAAILFQKDTQFGTWQAKAAVTHDWSGDTRAGLSIGATFG